MTPFDPPTPTLDTVRFHIETRIVRRKVFNDEDLTDRNGFSEEVYIALRAPNGTGRGIHRARSATARGRMKPLVECLSKIPIVPPPTNTSGCEDPVAVSGSIQIARGSQHVFIGAPGEDTSGSGQDEGRVYIAEPPSPHGGGSGDIEQANDWTIRKLEAPWGKANSERFGDAIAIDDDGLYVAVSGQFTEGRVAFYELDTATNQYEHVATLATSPSSKEFGDALVMLGSYADRTLILAGTATGGEFSEDNEIWVFEVNSDGSWDTTPDWTLTDADVAVDASLDGSVYLGEVLALAESQGDTRLIIGDPEIEDSGRDNGGVLVYERASASSWTFVQHIVETSSGATKGEWRGNRWGRSGGVSAAGDWLALGGCTGSNFSGDTSPTCGSHAQLWKWNGSAYEKKVHLWGHTVRTRRRYKLTVGGTLSGEQFRIKVWDADLSPTTPAYIGWASTTDATGVIKTTRDNLISNFNASFFNSGRMTASAGATDGELFVETNTADIEHEPRFTLQLDDPGGSATFTLEDVSAWPTPDPSSTLEYQLPVPPPNGVSDDIDHDRHGFSASQFGRFDVFLDPRGILLVREEGRRITDYEDPFSYAKTGHLKGSMVHILTFKEATGALRWWTGITEETVELVTPQSLAFGSAYVTPRYGPTLFGRTMALLDDFLVLGAPNELHNSQFRPFSQFTVYDGSTGAAYAYRIDTATLVAGR